MIWYIVWSLIAAAMLWLVGAMFFHDIARLNRREPLRIPFIGWADPGDLTYPLAVLELFGPYVTLGAAITFMMGFSAWLAAFGG